MKTEYYEEVWASVKVTIRYYDSEENLQEYQQGVTKIGSDWVELNGYSKFHINPNGGRLEQHIPKYNKVEYILESLEEIKELHDKARTFKVGDGVHYSIGSDTYPGTVIEIRRKGQVVVVQDDKGIPYHKDIFDNQDWDFVKNPKGATREFWRKRDRYYRLKDHNFGTLYHGRHKYYDPHF
jgi:hypothetical protein